MDALTFRGVVLLLPLASALHVLEEWPRFPRWVRRFASPRYTDREYLVTHALTVAGSLAASVALHAFPLPPLVFLFFLLWLGPGVFCNAFFHAGASVASRSYCPGTLTGLFVYLPLSFALAWLAVREELLSAGALPLLLAGAAALHALEVRRNVFKRW